MEAQASDSYPAAADQSNSAMEAQASDSYPAAADHIATVLWKCRLVAAIQQLYKLLYKSCIEAKQNIKCSSVAGRDLTALLAPAHLSSS